MFKASCLKFRTFRMKYKTFIFITETMIKLRTPPEHTALFPSSRSVSASMWCCFGSGSGSGL